METAGIWLPPLHAGGMGLSSKRKGRCLPDDPICLRNSWDTKECAKSRQNVDLEQQQKSILFFNLEADKKLLDFCVCRLRNKSTSEKGASIVLGTRLALMGVFVIPEQRMIRG